MAPTAAAAAVSLPLVLRASFIFSGMFGIQLDVKDQNGQPITFQSAMPLNFTVPAVVMNQTFDQHFTPDRTNKTRCLDKCKPENGSNGLAISIALPTSYVQTTTTTTMKPLLGKPCGPGRCSHDEICVSWMKQNGKSQKNRRESPMMVHECLPNDGIHRSKMNPTGARLCEYGKTHSILSKQSHRNCDGWPEEQEGKDIQKSCNVVWHYMCVDEKDSPHSCALRECPFKGACIEEKHCDLKQLCYVQAMCIPNFLIPENIRQTLRANAIK